MAVSQSKANWGPMFGRLVQMVLGITVIGLYGQDLNRAHREGKYSDGKWVYAVVVGSLASFTALVYIFVLFFSRKGAIALLAPWDLILFILWTAVFGIFGSMYTHEKVEMEAGIQRMKNAVWVDLINMILWLASAIWGACVYFFSSSRRSRSTGTAKS